MNKSRATILAGAFVVFVATYSARAAEATGESVARRLAGIRHEQAVAWAKQDGVQLPASVQDFFRAAQDGTWAAVRTPYRAISDERPLRSPWLFRVIVDVDGAYQEEHLWSPDLLDQFVRDVLCDIPDGSIYFGRTMAGLFAVTGWAAVHRPGEMFVMTQNGLADGEYLEFLARLYPSGIWLPSEKDLANARREYDKKVQSGQRPMVGVVEALGVMEINGILSKEVFERNSTNHACFIEVPRVRSWMNPHLEPHGLIMKLTNDRRGAIPSDVVNQDRLYWDEKERRLLGDERFTACPPARRTYSRCRSAFGGLYAARGMPKESEYAFRQAIRIYPLFDRPYYRLVREVMLPQERFDDARAVLLELKEAGPDVHMIAEMKDIREAYGRLDDESAFEKGEKDGFYQRVDSYLEHITKEREKRKALQKPE